MSARYFASTRIMITAALSAVTLVGTTAEVAQAAVSRNDQTAVAVTAGSLRHRSPSLSAVTLTVQTPRLQMSYRQFGHGPDLLLIPGFGCTMDDWDPLFLDALAANNHVTVFNHDGVGQTQATGAQLNVQVLAEDAAALSTALNLNHPNVLGWSMGGMVAQDLAIHHPGLIRRLVLAGSIPGGPATTTPGQAAIAALQDVTHPVQDIWTQFFPEDRQDEIPAWTARIQARSDYHAMTIPESLPLRGVLTQYIFQPTSPDLASIKVPTLVADGSLDTVTPPENSVTLAHTIPGAELRLYRHSGHAFIVQYPRQFAHDITVFLFAKH